MRPTYEPSAEAYREKVQAFLAETHYHHTDESDNPACRSFLAAIDGFENPPVAVASSA